MFQLERGDSEVLERSVDGWEGTVGSGSGSVSLESSVLDPSSSGGGDGVTTHRDRSKTEEGPESKAKTSYSSLGVKGDPGNPTVLRPPSHPTSRMCDIL